MQSSNRAESAAVSCFSTGRTALLLLCRFRTGVAESDVSVMEFMVPTQVVDLSDLNMIPLFGN